MKLSDYSFNGDLASQQFMKSLKGNTQDNYRQGWFHFLQFTGLTGDQILLSRRTQTKLPEDDLERFNWEHKVTEFKEWIAQQISPEKKRPYASSTARAYTIAARSFFAYNRSQLRFIRREREALTDDEPVYEDYRFTKDELRRAAEVGDVEEEYVVTVGKSFGLRAGDFVKLTRGQLEPYLDREPPIFIGELVTEKEKVKAFPFIDSDAKPVIKAIIQKMNSQGRTDPNDRIIPYSNDIQLSRALKRAVEATNIFTGNKRVRFHCLRKFLIDHLASYMSESKWKQIVGKTIDEKAYVSPDSLATDYKRVMGETTWATIQPCADGKHCEESFEQIPETQLLTYLKLGWQIVHKLGNGDLIVKSG